MDRARGRVRMRGGRGRGGGRGGGRGRDGGRGRNGGRGRGQARGIGGQRRRGPSLSNEIRATLVDHVVNHGLTMKEAGLRVQPTLSRFTVASVIRTFRLQNRIERQERQGGRAPIFTDQQEEAIIDMVLANNAIRLREIQTRILNDNRIFQNIHQVSVSTLARILKKRHLNMKQLYRVPFERNFPRVKMLRHDYAERVLQLDGEAVPPTFIYIDEAGFNLTKARRRGRNIIGHRAITNVPGQRGGNITLCAAISQDGVIHRHARMGPYNTALILTFLNELYDILTAINRIGQYIVIWDNVSFHRSALVQDWFRQHPPFTTLYLPPYSPFLNPIEEFFSAWRWKVYDLRPQVQIPLIQAMEMACDQIDAQPIQGWIRHSRRFFPRCLAREDIACDVDKILWPDPARRRDV